MPDDRRATGPFGCQAAASRRRHIVVAVPQCSRLGAVAVVAVKQARELARRFSVTVVSDSLPELPDGVSGLLVRPMRFDFLRRFGHVPNETAFCLSVRSALKRLSGAEGLDAVICHGHGLGALAGASLSRDGLAHCIIVNHGDIDSRPPGTYDWRLTAFYRVVTRPAHEASGLVVALTPLMAERAVAAGADRGKVAVIPNGVDLEDLGPCAGSSPPLNASAVAPGRRTIEVLFVGRLSMEKGVLVLASAHRALVAAGVGIRLKVVGDGPLRPRMEALLEDARDRGLAEMVGHVARSGLRRLYEMADVVCVPSLDDALPTVVLEALACGVPVVGSDIGGISFLVSNGLNGRLVPAGDAVRLREALGGLAADQAELDCLKDGAGDGAAEFRRRHSWAVAGETLTEAVDAVLRSRARAAEETGA